MLSDQGADLVMAEIENLTEMQRSGGLTGALGNAMLNHLYELHRLRDIRFHEDAEWRWNSPTMWELHPDA
jgi:hypothetical protein